MHHIPLTVFPLEKYPFLLQTQGTLIVQFLPSFQKLPFSSHNSSCDKIFLILFITFFFFYHISQKKMIPRQFKFILLSSSIFFRLNLSFFSRLGLCQKLSKFHLHLRFLLPPYIYIIYNSKQKTPRILSCFQHFFYFSCVFIYFFVYLHKLCVNDSGFVFVSIASVFPCFWQGFFRYTI